MTDGYTSASVITNFIKAIKPEAELDFIFSYNKEHGLTYNMLSEYVSNYFDLIIIPDASIEEDNDYELIVKNNPNIKILILDHHNVFLRNTDKCITVNCFDGQYPNPDLSGVGVVRKFCEAYCRNYKTDENFLDEWIDLVSTGLVSDSMSLLSLENRYYVYEGLKEKNQKNEFINELQKRKEEDFAYGRTIISTGWTIGPLINGVVRYGKKLEQKDMFRAMIGEQEEIEYQPRRKSKNDPKPEAETHTLQWNMARVAINVKQRQDNAVRDYMEKVEEEIENKKLYENSVMFIDTTDIIDKKTVSGLCANKLASKYTRPVVLLRDKSSTEYGGSARGYDKGNISSINELITEAGGVAMGHSNACGIVFLKEKLPEIIKYCNEKYPLSSLETIHMVHWEIPAKELRKEYIQEVAESYNIWGNDIEQPVFAISNLEINASNIQAYGDNKNFIRFEYNGISFIKKYCKHDEFDLMTQKTKNIFGKNKKNLVLNIIGQFILNSWEDKVMPQVKILFFDSKEKKDDVIDRILNDTDNDKAIEDNMRVKNKIQKSEKISQSSCNKKKLVVDLDNENFIF